MGVFPTNPHVFCGLGQGSQQCDPFLWILKCEVMVVSQKRRDCSLQFRGLTGRCAGGVAWGQNPSIVKKSELSRQTKLLIYWSVCDTIIR